MKKSLCSFAGMLLFTITAKSQQLPSKPVWDTVITGHFSKADYKQITYLPVNVPAGITSFNMQASISDSVNNVLDIGLFDEKGIDLGTPNGFRGWAGGKSSKSVTISTADATPSYIPGTVNRGLWHIMIVPTTIKQDGFDYTIKVALGSYPVIAPDFKATPARESINNQPGWYRGDLHMHDVNSDGVYNPALLVEYAAKAGLRFMISTNHNTNAAALKWGKYEHKNLLIMNGEEITPHEENHWNAIGVTPYTWIDWRYNAASGLVARFQQQVRDSGGLCIINHPFYDSDPAVDTRFPATGFDGIEVWNGPWEINDEYAVDWWDKMLRRKQKITAIGASDTHNPVSRNTAGHPQTVVHATGLNRKAIIGGLKKGSCYIAADSSYIADFQLGCEKQKAGIGETLHTGKKKKITIHYSFKHLDGATLYFYSNKGLLYAIPKITSSKPQQYIVTNAQEHTYIRAEVRDPNNKMLLLTNPVWID
ncbi:CehA/McbA family metallohydrolase [Deminuibacter soli]|uniref:Phosphoesterase n=1 Tax=Deminuibacter soli TaxID=2291815 RepID=A0A3E1NNM7_9BACT|nr:CehA/McbA family metallohydrolase [Deminuibacter soli]RFM29536.1 hypothetical protein DXN05_00690 [Deminuibacter soli]